MKEIPATPEMLASIAKVTGAAVDPNAIAIFEAIGLNTKPIEKRGGLYNGATNATVTLQQMQNHVKAGESVPLHTMHQQSLGEMPVGKVFDAQVLPLSASDSELRILFFLSRATQANLIADLNNGVIDEVSIAIRGQQILCSVEDCGFDYLGADSTIENWMDCACANGHTIGEDGVHAVVTGLSKWYETSLVSLGAADHAKIVGRAKQVMGRDKAAYDALAASGAPVHAHTILFASTVQPKQENRVMADTAIEGMAALTASVTTLATEKGTLTAQLATASASVTALTASLAERDTKIVELTAAVAAGTEGMKLKADADKMLAFLKDSSLKAQIAAGKSAPVAGETVDALIAEITAGGQHLALTLAAGAKAEAAAAGATKDADAPQRADSNAFRVK